MNISTASKHSESNGVKVLLHGFSGVGKTRAAASLHDEGYKPLFISAEGGTKSLADSEIPLVDISVDDDGKALPMEKRFDRLGEVFKFLKEEKHDYKTIYLDSLTEVNKTLIAKLKADPKFADPKMSLPMFGLNLETMVKLSRAFRDLPFNCVLVALSSVDKDDVGRRFIQPDLVGQVANHLPPLMDEVLYLHNVDKDGKQITQFQCQSANSVVAKDRSGRLNMFEPNNLAKMFAKLGAIK